uniref:5' nucleotidase n=1 Tax=viral metagenome TaxID=1070528 RepID=A0A6M3L955_9ZZZZ
MTRNIICDIDGVICKYDFPKLIKKYFGVMIPNKGIFTYSLEDALGVPPKAVNNMFAREVFNPPNLVKGVVDNLNYFIDKDYAVLIYTNRLHFMTQGELGDWLETWGIPYTDIINGGELPTYVHAHIDDSPRKLLQVDEDTTVKHRILFSNPWNRGCLDILGKFERAKTWGEIRRIIDERWTP